MSSPRSFMERHHLLLRRLHSLSGIVPIGVFLIIHLVTNSSLAWGGAALRGEFKHLHLDFQQGGVAYFQKEVTWINMEVPHLLLMEITLWGAIAFHSILGCFYAMSGRSNTGAYPYGANWRYRLQRISGYVGILFIFYHVATLRWGWTWMVPPFDGSVPWDHHYAVSTLAMALRGGEEFTAAGLAVSAFYFIGVTLLVFHFANGLWTAAITWGLTITAGAQRRWGYVCFALGVALMALAWSSLAAAIAVDPREAREVESAIRESADQQKHTPTLPAAPPPGAGAATGPNGGS